MRLTDAQRRAIREAAAECFGPEARISIFGSRADDEARGGDIDLLVETPETDAEELIQQEIAFRARLVRSLGERKIDVLTDYPTRRSRPAVLDHARRTAISL